MASPSSNPWDTILTAQQKHWLTVTGLYDFSRKCGLVRAVTDFNPRNHCGRESESRYSKSYVANMSVIAWCSLFDRYLRDATNPLYTWRMEEIRMKSTDLVLWMERMREFGLYPLGLSSGDELSENWNKGITDFQMAFQSEGDMVAGSSLMIP